MKEFEVELTIESTHVYTVRARTPEEAETIAEGLYEDGERGNVVYSSIVDSDAIPVDDEPLEEEELSDPTYD